MNLVCVSLVMFRWSSKQTTTSPGHLFSSPSGHAKICQDLPSPISSSRGCIGSAQPLFAGWRDDPSMKRVTAPFARVKYLCSIGCSLVLRHAAILPWIHAIFLSVVWLPWKNPWVYRSHVFLEWCYGAKQIPSDPLKSHPWRRRLKKAQQEQPSKIPWARRAMPLTTASKTAEWISMNIWKIYMFWPWFEYNLNLVLIFFYVCSMHQTVFGKCGVPPPG